MCSIHPGCSDCFWYRLFNKEKSHDQKLAKLWNLPEKTENTPDTKRQPCRSKHINNTVEMQRRCSDAMCDVVHNIEAKMSSMQLQVKVKICRLGSTQKNHENH